MGRPATTMFIALLAACSWCLGAARPVPDSTGGPLPPPSVDAKQFKLLRDKWLAMKQRVEELETEVYAKDPQLKIVERVCAQVRADVERQGAVVDQKARDYLDANKSDPRVLENYKRLMHDYSQIYLIEVLIDPNKESLLKEIMVQPETIKFLAEQINREKPGTIADPPDPEKVWTVFRESTLDGKARAEAALKRDRDAAKLPHELEEFARLNAISRANGEMIYGPWLDRHLPRDLKQARLDVRGLTGELAHLWPGWADVEPTTVPK